MLRIGVCEDDSKYRESLAFLLEKYLHHRENDLIIEEFSTGDALLQWLEKHQGELDICFLDIEMPGKNGMETARNIRKKDARMLLVFLTGYREYVFDGYEVDALDYLLKPVRERKLQEVLDRARKLLSRKERDRFTFRNKEGIYRIPKNHILYFYSDRRKIYLVTSANVYGFYGKMEQVEEQAGEEFVRIHQRYLVRARAVMKVEKNQVFVPVSGKEGIQPEALPMSRSYQKAALLSFMKAILEGEE